MKTKIKIEDREDSHVFRFNRNLAPTLIPASKRMLKRRVRSIHHDKSGNIVIHTHTVRWAGREQTRFLEDEVTPESWAEIVTPEVLAHINPKRKIKKEWAYVLDENQVLVKNQSGDYNAGCTNIKRSQLIKVCKAILKDELPEEK